MEGQGLPSPKPPPKKKRVKSQAPKDKAKRRDRLLADEDVQELLQEERAADSRAMFDVDKAFETVALMEQCVRDSHKVARASQDTSDRRAEQVEKLELLNKDITEQMLDAVALYTRQEIHIEMQAAQIGRLTKQLAAYHGRKHTGRSVGRPRKEKEKAAATAESLAEERMEAVLHEAEEALKSVFEDKLNQELKVLRERHYFRNDEISRARQKNEEQ